MPPCGLKMGQTYTQLLIHLVFATKDRQKDLTARVRPELYRYLVALARQKETEVLALAGGLEHVHLLVSIPPKLSISELMQFLKANSSRWIRARFNPHFAWQGGYAAFSVSKSKQAEVCDYLSRQETHHQRTGFEEEYRSLLLRNEIHFENERLW